MSMAIESKIKNGEIKAEEKIVPLIEERWVKSLSPRQVKALEPEQVKALEPEQVKVLDSEKIIKALELMDKKTRNKIVNTFSKH